MPLNWQPFLRDAAFYAIAVVMLLVIVEDGMHVTPLLCPHVLALALALPL